MTNPFEQINSRLSNIESLLIDLKHKNEVETIEENLSPEQVAKILLVSTQTVYKYIRKGNIKAKYTGRSYLINRKDLDESLKEVKTLKYKRD
jgi:excisionase family DNA binding protein